MDIDDANRLPDERELEKLINAHFKAVPGQQYQEKAFPDIASGALPDVREKVIHDVHPEQFTEQAGFNNALVNKTNVLNPLTGRGKSASFPGTQQDFNLNDPQTSFPDPHFDKNDIPHSVAGSGRSIASPHLNADAFPAFSPGTVSLEKLPFQNDQPFEKELQHSLRHLHSFVPTSQIPSEFPVGSRDPSFYFLAYQNPFASADVLKTGAVRDRHTTHGISSFVKPPFDMHQVKKDFPILNEQVNGKPIIWLDNAATTQKPSLVIDRITYFYEHENSNIHRAAHELAARATDAYESARKKVQHFINAKSVNEIIFVRGTTEGINLVAQSWGEQNLKSGDEIILSHLEHHANIVPWQMLAAKKGLKLRIIPVDDDGQILLEEYGKLLNAKTKLVAFTHVSNALGTVTPAKIIIEMAHAQGAKVLLDGAQSISHMRVDVQQLNPDFFVFSGHKVFGPTGIGAVYGKEHILNETQPWQGGGNMIKDVTFEHTEYHNAPGRFEAGTGNIADAVGLGAAIDYVSKLGIDLISQYEHALLHYATHLIKEVPGLRQVGTAREKASVLSFTLEGYTNDEVGQALNKEGIAVRTGHHCAQPILRRFGLESTVRPSLAFYNTCGDVDVLVSTLHRLAENKKRNTRR